MTYKHNNRHYVYGISSYGVVAQNFRQSTLASISMLRGSTSTLNNERYAFDIVFVIIHNRNSNKIEQNFAAFKLASCSTRS